MKIKSVELKKFKRFTHLIVKDIPGTVKLVVLVGPNGSGKTSFMEAMNHYYKFSGYNNIGDYRYLLKEGNQDRQGGDDWYNEASKLVDINFYDASFPKIMGIAILKVIFILEVRTEMNRISKWNLWRDKITLQIHFDYHLLF